MCVAFWSLEHPQYALILCSNRDEYLSRPTAKAHWHSFGGVRDDAAGDGSILSGRDLRAGGTWAGVNRSGRVSLLTNITEPPGKYDSSRGNLTSSFLLPRTPSTFQDEVESIRAQNGKYAGFNLLLLSPRTRHGASLAYNASFVTNSGGGGTITTRDLSDEERCCGGMSNGIDRQGANEWPKVKHGIHALQEVLDSVTENSNESDLLEQLFGLLTWRSKGPIDRSTLRNTVQVEPIALPNPNGSNHTVHEYYGTRLSTVILVRRDGRVLFAERDVWKFSSEGHVAEAKSEDDRMFRFQIDWGDIDKSIDSL